MGAGDGAELVYIFGQGFAAYEQDGAGIGVPGVGADLSVGLIWDMPNADSYTRDFVKFGGGVPLFPEPALGIGPAVSVFGWPDSPVGFTVGAYGGMPGAAIMYEWYNKTNDWTGQ